MGGEFQVNTYTNGPALPFRRLGRQRQLRRRLDKLRRRTGDSTASLASGTTARQPLGGEFQVNTYTTSNQQLQRSPRTRAATSSSSGSSDSQDGSGSASSASGTTATGTPGQRVPGQHVHDELPATPRGRLGRERQLRRRLGELLPGRERPGIFGQRYDSGGNPVGGEFQVNTYTTYSPGPPCCRLGRDGNFVVVWQQPVPGWSELRRLRPAVRQQREPGRQRVPVNTYTTGLSVQGLGRLGRERQLRRRLGKLIPGRERYGVFGQRFSAGCEASVQVEGDVHTPGSMLAVQVHIAHHRPKTVTVPWELRLIDASGQLIGKRTTEPHTFEPGDVVDKDVQFRLPDDLASGTYTLSWQSAGWQARRGRRRPSE